MSSLNPPLRIIADENIYQVETYFKQLGEVVLLPAKEITAEALSNADVLLIRSKTIINSSLLEKSSLKFIGSTVSGTDHIDFSSLRSKSIKLSVAKGCNANSVALYSLLALFELQYRYYGHISLDKQQVGIVGYGNTAKKFIDKLGCFGALVRCYDPVLFHDKEARELVEHRHRDYVSITHNLSDIMQCPIISLHPSLHTSSPYSSYHLLDNKHIQLLTEKHIFLNTSRGEVVDEEALLRHSQKVPFHMALDCWQHEPNINSALLQRAHIATPHIAGHSVQAKLNGTQHCYQELCNLLGEIEEKYALATALNPAQPLDTIDLGNCQNAEEVVFAIHKNHYLPSRDQLDKNASPMEGAKKFNHYRKHYPERYEMAKRQLRFSNVPDNLTSFVQNIHEVL